MQVEIELALMDATVAELKEIRRILPYGMSAENRSAQGWGIVISTGQSSLNNPSDVVDEFLNSLHSLKEIIRRHKSVLRVAIFYTTINCTIRFKSCERLAELGLGLEISTYPVSDDE
ncbi:MAG: hypothetical protein LBU53_02105 [Zoogloeaceae bacterium]|jgi:hypothetical protein|nr:hypothetical protein [Zoogloeaceae bacterium]